MFVEHQIAILEWFLKKNICICTTPHYLINVLVLCAKNSFLKMYHRFCFYKPAELLREMMPICVSKLKYCNIHLPLFEPCGQQRHKYCVISLNSSETWNYFIKKEMSQFKRLNRILYKPCNGDEWEDLNWLRFSWKNVFLNNV